MHEEAVSDEGLECGKVIEPAKLGAFIYYIVSETEVHGKYRSLELHSERKACGQLLGKRRTVEADLVGHGIYACDMVRQIYTFIILDIDGRTHKEARCHAVQRIDVQGRHAELAVELVFLVLICDRLRVHRTAEDHVELGALEEALSRKLRPGLPAKLAYVHTRFGPAICGHAGSRAERPGCRYTRPDYIRTHIRQRRISVREMRHVKTRRKRPTAKRTAEGRSAQPRLPLEHEPEVYVGIDLRAHDEVPVPSRRCAEVPLVIERKRLAEAGDLRPLEHVEGHRRTHDLMVEERIRGHADALVCRRHDAAKTRGRREAEGVLDMR